MSTRRTNLLLILIHSVGKTDVKEMARMHSRKHGKSGSKKPMRREVPEWLGYSKDEVEKLIIKLAKEGNSASRVGLVLRDQYGIPDVRALGIRVSDIIEKHGMRKEVPEDMFNLMKKAVDLRRHLERNKRDYISKHGLELTESKIRRLGKYYAKSGKLPADWRYDVEQAKLLVK